MEQKTQSLSDFIWQSKGSKKDLRDFCMKAFEEEWHGNTRYCSERDLHFRIINRPFKENGNLTIWIFRRRERVRISVNLHRFLRDKNCSVQMKYVFLYSTIVHELEHLHLFRLLKCQTGLTYPEVIAAWDQFCWRFGASNEVHNLLVPQKRKMKKRYDSSPAEIHCNLTGMRRAYEILHKDLSEACRAKTEKMIEGLSLMSSNQEIRFYRENRQSSLFPATLRYMSILCQKRKIEADRLPVVRLLFDESGRMISLEEIIRRMEASNKELYEEVLLRLFIYLDRNWKDTFEFNPAIKQVINRLADDYCKSAMNFLSNQEIVQIFLSSEIVERNAVELVHNVQILKKQMKAHGMISTAGGVFPLYRN